MGSFLSICTLFLTLLTFRYRFQHVFFLGPTWYPF